ncbi:F-box and associated interaction domains-containing protein [Euphorbia peplus]|nr:F-box and associated interaction domains-containing protein [Euphorbia peplus]
MASKNGEESISVLSTKSSSELKPAIPWLEGLPREVYLDILSRQSIFSLLDSKLVSRLWHTSVKDPSLAKLQLIQASENSLCLLIFSDWPKSKLQLVEAGNPEANMAKTLKNPFQQVLTEFEVVGSCNGLVCLNNYFYDDPLCLYNPFTIEHKELPTIGASSLSNKCRVVFGFGFHPKTEEYKVIEIIYYKQGNFDLAGGSPEVFVLTLNRVPTWRNIGKIRFDLTGPTSEALVNGKLHWLTFTLVDADVRYREIVSFDVETERFEVVPSPSYGSSNQTDYHLVSLRGFLSAIVQCNDGSNEVWMMKEYNVKSSWSKEFVIGNYMPDGWRRNMVPPARRRINGCQGRKFRVLCGLKDGEVLIIYWSRCIVSYNPKSGEFKDVHYQELPLEFQAFAHLGSLVSINSIFGMGQ